MVLWVVLALSSAFFFGLKDILAKKFFRQNTSPTQLIFEEYIVLLLICITILFPYIDLSTFSQYWFLYIAKALTIGAASLFYFVLLKEYDISQVSPLLNLSPLVLLLLSSIFLSEQITLIQLAGIFIILISTYFLEVTIVHHRKDKPHKHHFDFLKKFKLKFVILGFIALIAISFTAIIDKILLVEINISTNLFFTAVIILIMIISYYIKEKKLIKAIKFIKKEPETLLIGALHIISIFLILGAIAIPSALVSLIIPLRRTSTLFSSIIGGIMFHEKHIKKKFYSTIGMLIGVFLIVL
jgi:uncharacterized membrane protein